MVDSSAPTLRDALGLAWMLAKRDLKHRYASSYGGVTWNIGVPLLYALTNVIVFSVLMSGRMGERYGDIPFALFFFVPFSLWIVFAEVAARSTSILKDYAYLINKIAFPVWVLPLIPFASALVSQLVILVISVGLLLYFDVSIADTAGFYILTWIILVTLTLGVSYLISALSAFIPDMAQAVPIGVNIFFWLTPILYPATLVENYGIVWIENIIINFNPFHYLIDMSRHAVFGSAQISWTIIGAMSLVSVLVLLLGTWVFRKLQPGFADVI